MLLVLVAQRLISREPLAAVALATLAALLVMGQLDSVLQVPAGATVAALVLGLGLPRAAAVASPKIAWPLRAALAASAVYVALLFAACVVRTRERTGFTQLEFASRLAPGDPLLHQTLAEALVLEGRCADARPHLDALASQLPFHPSVKSLRAACEGQVR